MHTDYFIGACTDGCVCAHVNISTNACACKSIEEIVRENRGSFIDMCEFYKEIKDDLLIHSFYYTLRKLQFISQIFTNFLRPIQY